MTTMLRRVLLGSLIVASIIGGLALIASAYEVTTVSNGGTVEGKVAFTGAKPAPLKIIPTKDREACGGAREVEPLQLSADKGVAEAVVWVKQVERGKPWDKPAAPPQLGNSGCDFVPRVQIVPVGQELEFANNDPVFHNLHTFLDKTTVHNVSLPKNGRKIRRSFTEPGLVKVECDAHAWMKAWIYVADSPYYAMTGKDGRFSIGDLPPGKYTLAVWHEYTGLSEVPFTVAPGATVPLTVTLSKAATK
jgi:plastocyanin